MMTTQDSSENESEQSRRPKRELRHSFAGRMLPGLLLVALTVTSPAFAVPDDTATEPERKTVEWHSNFEEALTKAAEQDKVVLLRFTADWCAPCRVMDASVWPDEKVQAALAEKYILVKSDIDKPVSRALAQRFRVRGVPTLVQLDADGVEFARGSFMSAAAMLRFLEEKPSPTAGSEGS